MSLHRLSRPLALGAALACLLASGTAGAIVVAGRPAASAARASPAPAAASHPAFGTRDQLRDCLDGEDAIHERLRRFEEARKAHEQAVDDLAAENTKIAEVQAQLDTQSQTAVTAYNLLITQHNVRTDEINREAREMTAQSQAFNADSVALGKRCSAMAYRLEDMDAVTKERKAAGK
jgi:hypothetical protein